MPQWVFGFSRYDFLPDGTIAFLYAQDGTDVLGLIRPGTDSVEALSTGLTSLDYCHTSASGRIWAIGGSPTEFSAVVSIDPKSGAVEAVHRSSQLSIDSGYVSVAEPIEFPTEQGLTAHALLLPPDQPGIRRIVRRAAAAARAEPWWPDQCHRRAAQPRNPVLDQPRLRRARRQLRRQHRLRAGLPRAAQRATGASWTSTTASTRAHYLAERGDVDGKRLAIRGGSAGGYTTLAALTFRDVFAAGASHYGVSDLRRLRQRDAQVRVALPRRPGRTRIPKRRDLYDARSAAYHHRSLVVPADPLPGARGQGRAAEPGRADGRGAAAQGAPVAYVAFEGEQHGFRRAENIKRCLEAELYFYSRIFGFELADDIEPITIENL